MVHVLSNCLPGRPVHQLYADNSGNGDYTKAKRCNRVLHKYDRWHTIPMSWQRWCLNPPLFLQLLDLLDLLLRSPLYAQSAELK